MAKRIKILIQNKHDLEVNWLLAENYIPLQGELVVYDTEVDAAGNILTKVIDGSVIQLLPAGRTEPYHHARIKVGDGIHKLGALPFIADLSQQALKSELPTKTSQLENDNGYITLAEVPDTDLSSYAKKSEIPDVSKFITNIPAEYITEQELESKGYLTEHQSLEGYATKEAIKNFITEVPDEYITKSELEDRGYLTQHQSLEAYAKKTDIPDVSGFISEIPEGYITEAELVAKGYLVAQNLDGLATADYVNDQLSYKVDKETGKGLSANDYTTAEKIKLAGIADGANKTIVDAALSVTSENPVQNRAVSAAITEVSEALAGKSAIGHGHDNYIQISTKGVASGVAELDENGKVLAYQLPSFVDDVIESDSKTSFPAVGESSKIYVAVDEGKTYRWSGSAYVEISASLALGETAATAYRGDRGKTAYEHSQVISGNPHQVTKSDIGLGSVENKSSETIRGELTKTNVTTALGYEPATKDVATTAMAGLMDSTDKTKLVNLGTLVGNKKVSEQISEAISKIDYPIDSVNDKTGAVQLTASDVGADTAGAAAQALSSANAYTNSKVAELIDTLEQKSNKVIGTIPSANWTDAQYPSAKTLYSTYMKLLDLMHPVNSILATATNVNPATTLGGTWVLVDKSFKDAYLTLDSSYWTGTNASINTYSNIMLTDHTISLRLSLVTNVAVGDTTITLGKLAIDSCGIGKLSHAIFCEAAISDEGNCTINYRIEQTGEIKVYDVLNVDGTHTLASGSTLYIHLVQPITYNNMQDDFCDKFYWKRTA